MAATSGSDSPPEGAEGTVESPVEEPLEDVLGPLADSWEADAPAEGGVDLGSFSPDGNVPQRPSRRRSFSSPVVESVPFPSVEEMMGTQDVDDLFGDGWGIPDENTAPGSEEAPLEISPGPEMPVPPRPSRQRSASPADIESAPFPSVEELRGTSVTPEIFVDERDRPQSKSPRFNVSGFGSGPPPRSPSPVPAPGRLYAEERPAMSFPKMGIFGTKQPVVPETAASVDEDGTISPTDMERMDGMENMDWATELLDADFLSPTFRSMGPEDPPTGVTQADTVPGVSDSRPGSAPPLGVGSNPVAAPDLSLTNMPQGGWLSGFPPVIPPQNLPQAVPRRRLRETGSEEPLVGRTVPPSLSSAPGTNVSSEFGSGQIPGWGRLPRFTINHNAVASGGLGADPAPVPPPVDDIPDFAISDLQDGGGPTDDPPAAPVPPFSTAAPVTNPQSVPPVMPTEYFTQDLDPGNIAVGGGTTGFPPAVSAPHAIRGPSTANPLPNLRMGNVSDLGVRPNLPAVDPELTTLNTVGVREVPCLGCLVLLINWTMWDDVPALCYQLGEYPLLRRPFPSYLNSLVFFSFFGWPQNLLRTLWISSFLTAGVEQEGRAGASDANSLGSTA